MSWSKEYIYCQYHSQDGADVAKCTRCGRCVECGHGLASPGLCNDCYSDQSRPIDD
jgi:hypothetical protein